MSENQPLVSVIMNCFNSEKYLKEAIDSVYSQTYSNWEIIFWDNASTDNSSKIALSYDERLKYFCAKKTSSLGEARNLAMKKAAGEYIAFIDCDDIWLPLKLERQLPLFNDKQVGLVYSDSIYFNMNGRESCLYSQRKPYKGWCFIELLTNYALSMQTVVIRKDVLDGLDYWFDNSFNAIEEYDLFVRIGEKWKIDYYPAPLAKWRVHSESWTYNNLIDFINEKKILIKNLYQRTDFKKKYPRILNKLSDSIVEQEAKYYWSIGNSRKSRYIIYKANIYSFNACLIYMLSFLPYNLIDSFWCRIKKGVRPI